MKKIQFLEILRVPLASMFQSRHQSETIARLHETYAKSFGGGLPDSEYAYVRRDLVK